MKHKIIFLISFLFLFSITSEAQDISNFYRITGFNLTPIKSGQYVLTLSPSYFRYSSIGNYHTLSSEQSSTSTSDYPESYFNVYSSFLWGMSDGTTVSLILGYTPKQSLGQNTQSSVSTNTSIPSSSNMNYKSDNEIEDFQSRIVIAHRPRSNLELSLDFNYFTSNAPRLGTQIINGTNPTYNTSYDISSLDERQSYSITFNIVLLGN